MSLERLSILLIEDNPGDARLIREMLIDGGAGSVQLEIVAQLAAGLARLDERPIEVILLDLSLPDSHGLETFARVHQHVPAIPIVVLSGLADETMAVKAVQAGAQDYLVKGQVDGPLLVRSLRYAVERGRAVQERAQLLAREQQARAEAEAAQRRLAFLSEASKALASSLDYETIVQRVPQLVQPELADGCLLDIEHENGELLRVAAAQNEPQQEQLGRYLESMPLAPVLAAAIARATESGQAELLSAPAADGQELTPRLVVPLLARGRTLGFMILLLRDPGRSYEPDDIPLAEELGRRAALAIDNARLYQEAQQAIQVRDEFLATAAHDLNAPLTAVKGYAQLLQRRASRLADTVELDWLFQGLLRIENSITKMSIMLNELLDLARMQIGRPLGLDRQQTNVVALVEQVVIEHQQATRHHTLCVECPMTELLGSWDTNRLERVLDNLLANAVKYSPDGGQITVRIKQEPGWAVLEVCDQGIGIPAADLPHIFERFRRGSNVVGHFSGMGLGLAGVHQIIEEHGGRILVESQEGAGTTMVVRLPIAVEYAGTSCG